MRKECFIAGIAHSCWSMGSYKDEIGLEFSAEVVPTHHRYLSSGGPLPRFNPGKLVSEMEDATSWRFGKGSLVVFPSSSPGHSVSFFLFGKGFAVTDPIHPQRPGPHMLTCLGLRQDSTFLLGTTAHRMAGRLPKEKADGFHSPLREAHIQQGLTGPQSAPQPRARRPCRLCS